MDIENLVSKLSYHNKHVQLAFINRNEGMIIYLFDKRSYEDDGGDDYDSIITVLLDLVTGIYDMNLPYVNQLNMYYGDYEPYESKYIGKHYKKLIKALNNHRK